MTTCPTCHGKDGLHGIDCGFTSVRPHMTHHDDCGCKSAEYERRIAEMEADKKAAREDAVYQEDRAERAEAELAALTERSHSWGTLMHELMNERDALRDGRCDGCAHCDTCAVQNAAWVKFGALKADTGFSCNCWAERSTP